jgi:hypothetical protein
MLAWQRLCGFLMNRRIFGTSHPGTFSRETLLMHTELFTVVPHNLRGMEPEVLHIPRFSPRAVR